MKQEERNGTATESSHTAFQQRVQLSKTKRLRTWRCRSNSSSNFASVLKRHFREFSPRIKQPWRRINTLAGKSAGPIKNAVIRCFPWPESFSKILPAFIRIRENLAHARICPPCSGGRAECILRTRLLPGGCTSLKLIRGGVAKTRGNF